MAARGASGRIPWAFTGLVAAAIGCLPSRTATRVCRARAGLELRVAVHAAEAAGAERWPEPAATLFARCREAVRDALPVIPAGTISPALDTRWPDTTPPAWQRRRDIGEHTEEGA